LHTFGVVDKCSRSSGRIEAGGRVVQKRCRAYGGVLGSLTRILISDIEKERSRAQSGVAPSVSLQSENQPTVVFPTPAVRLNRAFCPSAVLKPE
jgi:hypothetical protein